MLVAPVRQAQFVYLHDRNAEVGVDEGCGSTCLDWAELWKTTFHHLVFMCSCHENPLCLLPCVEVTIFLSSFNLTHNIYIFTIKFKKKVK